MFLFCILIDCFSDKLDPRPKKDLSPKLLLVDSGPPLFSPCQPLRYNAPHHATVAAVSKLLAAKARNHFTKAEPKNRLSIESLAQSKLFADLGNNSDVT
jgi:hypothetical protein